MRFAISEKKIGISTIIVTVGVNGLCACDLLLLAIGMTPLMSFSTPFMDAMLIVIAPLFVAVGVALATAK